MSRSKGTGAASVAPHPSERVEAALEFAEFGCRVGPVRGKDPGGYLGKGWQDQFSRCPEGIVGWWARWPDANVGIIPDRSCVPVDVDDAGAFQRLQAETVVAPPTPRYFTGGGVARERLLFAYDERLEHADRMLANGVQLRHWKPGSSLMSTVPPSVHPDSGAELEWTIELDETPLAPLPGAWLERVLPSTNARRVARPASEWVRLFCRDHGEGERHLAMMSAAGYLVRKLGSGRLAFELLSAWNEQRCNPPLPKDETAEMVTWAAKREAARRKAVRR
jgi:Bifunctional DNA primase/polymerase, N-terminal/Primase C terminal 1 (PriCT-1)